MPKAKKKKPWMTRLVIESHPEVAEAIKKACGGRAVGPTLEGWILKRPEVKSACKELGLTIPERRGPGQPRKSKE